jgi:hypothetical protein
MKLKNIWKDGIEHGSINDNKQQLEFLYISIGLQFYNVDMY